ncbi:MAG: hypothetical protein ACRDVP_12095 [Acidimicrobiales bacterium]
MTSVGIVALDGTKMAANASMSANRISKQTIDDAVEEMFADAKATDEAEDARFGDARGDEPPATLRGRADHRRRFKQAKELLDKELEEERKAHEAHLAERQAEEERRGKKLRGRKPKAPKDKAGAKEKKINHHRHRVQGHVDRQGLPRGLQRSGGREQRAGDRRC